MQTRSKLALLELIGGLFGWIWIIASVASTYSLVAALALLLSPVVFGAEGHQGPEPSDDARFEFLKGLEGAWVGNSDSEEMPENRFEFHVTAGGHAVEEREMIGTPMEMLTVYHMESDKLVANHYCILGNQPRAIAARDVEENTLDFACTGKPASARSHADEHVHGWVMRLDDEGRLHYSAELMKQGQVTETPEFVLTRESKTASR